MRRRTFNKGGPKMPKRTPEEALVRLKELARPCLGNQDMIVVAAMSESPNAVAKHAQGRGFSVRQVRAIKALVRLHIQLTPEAYQEFLSSKNRADQEDQAPPVSAQEDRPVGNTYPEDLHPLFARVKNPLHRLQILIAEGLKEQAGQFIMWLATERTSFFWLNESGGKICHWQIFQHPSEKAGVLENIVWVCHDKEGFCTRRYHGKSQEEIQTDVLGLFSWLEWDAMQRRTFVQVILKKTMFRDPEKTKYDYWALLGTQQVMRTFLTSRDKILRRAEIWLAKSTLWHETIYDVYRYHVPADQYPAEQVEEDGVKLAPVRKSDTAAVYLFCKWLKDMGMTEKSIKSMFLRWLGRRDSSCMNETALVIVAGLPCLKDEDLKSVLRPYLRVVWETLLSSSTGWRFQIFKRLGELGLWEPNTTTWVQKKQESVPIDNDREFFVQELTRLLSEGRSGFVFNFLVKFGKATGMFSEIKKEVSCFGSDNLMDNSKLAQAVMAKLALQAYVLARDAEQFGIAAAISQKFDVYDSLEARVQASMEQVPKLQKAGYFQSSNPAYDQVDAFLEDVWDKDIDYTSQAEAYRDGVIREHRRIREVRIDELRSAHYQELHRIVDLSQKLKQPITLKDMETISFD